MRTGSLIASAKKSFVLLIIFLAACPQLFAAEKDKTPASEAVPISVKAEVDRAFITIGDPVEYTITVRHTPSVKVLSSFPPPAADILQIKKVEEFKREEKGFIVEGRKLKLTAFRLGEFILAPVKIEYRIGDGQPQSIETEKIFLTVKSIDAGKAKEDIRGVKGVLSIPQKWLKWVLAGVLLLLASVFGFLIYQSFKKKRLEAGRPETALTPEEEAILHLNQLFDSDLLKKGRFKDYYLRLSEILRFFFERKFHVLAVESTTFEVLRLLRGKEIPSTLMTKIQEVLEAADLAKFAKWQPEPTQIIAINKKSKEIIDELTPQTHPEAPSGL